MACKGQRFESPYLPYVLESDTLTSTKVPPNEEHFPSDPTFGLDPNANNAVARFKGIFPILLVNTPLFTHWAISFGRDQVIKIET
jgi:hypothetical protein